MVMMMTTRAENCIPQLIKLNCSLKNLVHAHRFTDALSLFQQIHSLRRLKPDHYTLSTALTACANSRQIRVGVQLHALCVKSDLLSFSHVANTLLSFYAKTRDLTSVKRVYAGISKPDVYSHTTLLSACTKLGEVDYARMVFDQMPERNVAVWNATVTGCAENRHQAIALDFFRRMRVLDVQADNYAFACVLRLCSSGQLHFGRQLHCLVFKNGVLRQGSVVNSLITMYINCKSPGDADAVVEEIGQQVTSRDPGTETVTTHSRREPNDERVIFRVALQDLSQPKLEASPPDGVLSVNLLKHQQE